MKNIREQAQDYLARREHSRFELQKKLLEDGFSENDIAATLDQLQAEGLQDDVQFAENYVRIRKNAGYGPERIHYELRHKGIAKNLIAEKINVHSVDWRRHLLALMARRFPNGVDKREGLRFLTTRGYTSEEIFRYLNLENLDQSD